MNLEILQNRFDFLLKGNKKQFYIKLKNDYPNLRKLYLKTIQIDYLISIRELLAADQLLRNKPFVNDKNFSSYLSIIDSISFLRFKELVNQNGFPGHSIIGYYSDLTPLIAHMVMINEESFNYLDSLMKNAINQGEFEPNDYAWIIDRRRLFANLGFSIYGGTWPEEEYENIEDIKNVDKRRKAIYLPTLEQDSKITGRKLPPEYSKLK